MAHTEYRRSREPLARPVDRAAPLWPRPPPRSPRQGRANRASARARGRRRCAAVSRGKLQRPMAGLASRPLAQRARRPQAPRAESPSSTAVRRHRITHHFPKRADWQVWLLWLKQNIAVAEVPGSRRDQTARSRATARKSVLFPNPEAPPNRTVSPRKIRDIHIGDKRLTIR